MFFLNKAIPIALQFAVFAYYFVNNYCKPIWKILLSTFLFDILSNLKIIVLDFNSTFVIYKPLLLGGKLTSIKVFSLDTRM
jgi:hypothetical protein